jgi:hypothetical protein
MSAKTAIHRVAIPMNASTKNTVLILNDEIRSLLSFRDRPELNCVEVDVLLDKHIGHVADRITALKALQKQLTALRSQCQAAQSSKDCGILQSLSQPENTAPRNLGTHGGGCH